MKFPTLIKAGKKEDYNELFMEVN